MLLSKKLYGTMVNPYLVTLLCIPFMELEYISSATNVKLLSPQKGVFICLAYHV